MAKKNVRLDGRTSKGTFAKGNPGRTALTKVDAGHPADLPEVKQMRNDGWSNFFTGHGVFGKDKRYGASFKADVLSFDQMMELARGDDLAKRAGETLPKEAFRQGWDLVISEEEGVQDEDERVQEIYDELERLGAKTHIKTALAWERFYGGSAVLLGVNDGQADLSKPLALDRVRSIDWLTPLEARELQPVYGYADPRAAKYGQPEIYRLVTRSILPSADGTFSQQTVDIHESRLLIFPGNRVSRYQVTSQVGGWGDSILVPMWRVLRDFNLTWAAAGALVADFSSAVYKFKDLWETLASDDAEEFQRRIATMELTRSTINATVIDSEDDFSRSSSSVAGLPDLLDKFATRLAAAADMPLTLLFGTSPAGMNATGESDIRFFYDRVAEYQEERVLPNLKRLLQILFRTTGTRAEPTKWSVSFRPLWQESAKDKAGAMLTQAQADTSWITAGVLSAEEVASSHWGTGKYNPDITVDFAARERQEQAAQAPINQGDLNALDPDHPGYQGTSLDPNSNHKASALPGQDVKGNPIPVDENGNPLPPGQPGQPGAPGAPGAPEVANPFEAGAEKAAKPAEPPQFAKKDAREWRRRLRMDWAKKAVKRDEWEESQHPRAENGKFGEGSGGSTSGLNEKQEREAKAADAGRRPLSHDAPAGWTDKPTPRGTLSFEAATAKAAELEKAKDAAPWHESKAIEADRKAALRAGYHSDQTYPKTWDTLDMISEPGRVYRGMSEEEFKSTVGSGKGILSNNSNSIAHVEGTSFGYDAATANSYVNNGATDPRKTGRPTYIVEVHPGEHITYNPVAQYPQSKRNTTVPQDHVTRVFKFEKSGDDDIEFKQISVRGTRGDEWDESLHPRAENGQFGAGGGGSTKASTPSSEGAEHTARLKEIAKNLPHESVRKSTPFAPGSEITARGVEREIAGVGSSRHDPITKAPSKGLEAIAKNIGETYKSTDPVHIPKQPLSPAAPWKGEANPFHDTQHAFQNPTTGKYSPERAAIHDKYIEEATHGVPKSDHQTVYMTGGGPAAGKTTALLNNPHAGIPDKKAAAHINADEAKEYIPEYLAGKRAGDKMAASFVHEESADMSKQGIKEALKAGHDIVYDSTGDGGYDTLRNKVNGMRQAGAKRVVANYAVLDIDEAIRRSDARAEHTGRFVPHAYLTAQHKAVSATLTQAMEKGLYDNCKVWDSSKREPKLVAEYDRHTGLVIHDKAAWAAVKKRGQE